MTVYLVGAGPGDPGLLTRRGAELLALADVVVHDRLADASLLSLAPAAVELIDVGKAPGGPVRQDDITRLLVERGRSGATVVRLKGGDPFVFGRGGEEALALQAAGVAFEVVPGVTSAVAVPAYAGIPVTHRGASAMVTVVTGHSRVELDREVDWSSLAKVGGTIVVLMGVAHRGHIAGRLIDGGLDPTTPVAAIGWGTRPEQTTVRTTLAGLAGAAVEPPATIVVGAVAALDLGWYETRPLFGRRVVVTRAGEQASALAGRLRALGARPVELPTIAIAGPADGGAALARAAAGLREGRYGWLACTSVNAVERLFAHLHVARALGGVLVAAMGPGTAAALAAHGIVADLVPARSVGEGMLAAWPPLPAAATGAAARRVLLPRAAVARDVLPDGLRAAGWDVDVVEAYRTVAATPSAALVAEAAGADAVCFTSASTVAGFLGAVGAGGAPPVVVTIGPVTSAAARRGGLTVDAEAVRHDLGGLVEALVAALAGPG
ncbi:MAG TPA: uroporphyrinogen-III C-methyltransferase [Acidimicrobiales bacterium]|nr:uroporphyrinogen-III C-methyltransferase [Acidimicrobiales bacterium]